MTPLDDTHEESEETPTLPLSNVAGAAVADGEATGTIENTEVMPAGLQARFPRATVEHIEERMATLHRPAAFLPGHTCLRNPSICGSVSRSLEMALLKRPHS